MKIYVGKKSESRMEDIIIYQFDGTNAHAEVRAQAGQMVFDPQTRVMKIDLERVRMTEFDKKDPGDLTKARTLSADRYPVVLDLRQMLKKSRIYKKPADMGFGELVRAIRNVRQAFPDILETNVPRMRAKMAVDASQRLALAMSCFSFTLLAIPLGIRSHRKDSSIGIGIALVLMFLFYLFILLADMLIDKPEWRPDLIPWIPVLASQFLGFGLLHRNR